MRVLVVHDRLGDLGGAEACVRHTAAGLTARGAEVALLHGPGTGTGEARWVTQFAARWDWSTDPDQAVAGALAWQPQVVLVHKLESSAVLGQLADSGLPAVRMWHDHHDFCQRGHRYLPWDRTPCTRRAGWMCGVLCGVVRQRDGRLPVTLAWPGTVLGRLARLRPWIRTNVVVTRYFREELLLNGFAAERIAIHPPVPKPAPAGYQPTWAEPLIVYTGQLIRGKGVDVLLEACARLTTPDWRLAVIGDGDQRAALVAQADRLGLTSRVQFTGWVRQEELHRHWQAARVATVPSMWPEPIATIGLEYLHHGLPVVGFDAGGISDWLRDGQNGFLIPFGDAPAFAVALDRLLADRGLAQRLGEQGQAQARAEYDQERYLDALHALLAAEV
jgi:glycosyltransferase involved in cell wall biosynthesis